MRNRQAAALGSSILYPFPPPVGGWNTRDPEAAMAETDAIRLVNWWPERGRVSIRKGQRLHATAGTEPIETLVSHTKADGTKQLIAAADKYFYDVTTYNATPEDITGETIPSSARWQSICVNHITVFFNGLDTPQQWNGSAMSDAIYTGSGLTSENLIAGCSYRDRVYLIEKETMNLWYGGVQAVTGALEKLDLSYIFKRGGYLQAVTTWTQDDAGGADDRLVCISSEGEVIIYTGDYPGNAFERVAQYFLPPILGYRCTAQYKGDLLILTTSGPISAQEVTLGRGAAELQTLSDKISPSIRDAAELYRSNWGWELLSFDRAPMLIVNIPIVSTSQYQQYVQNLQTKAWAAFTNLNGASWCVHDEKLYYGGPQGKVHQAWWGSSDGGGAIPVDLKCSFNSCKNAGRTKKFNGATIHAVSNAIFRAFADIDVDYGHKALTDTLYLTGPTGADWGMAQWGTATWAPGDIYSSKRFSVAGTGDAAALRLKGNYINVECSLLGLGLIYEPGGIT